MKARKNSRSVLILGGAGFIGSNLATKFYDEGWSVTVVDGILAHTGGRKTNLTPILKKIRFIQSPIEKLNGLERLIQNNTVIIDCMALTSHVLARKDPLYDLKLNAQSHLHLIEKAVLHPSKKIIYLGSRVQYGNPRHSKIKEETPMSPEDIQGIHKLTGESYFRIYSKLNGLRVVSLRLPNCFGPNQPVAGNDLGLVGNFVRDLLKGKKIDVFDGGRSRNFLFIEDLSNTILKLANKNFSGFQAFNLSGDKITIPGLAKTLVKIIGKGSFRIKKLPHEVKAGEMGSASMSEANLKRFIGRIPHTSMTTSLSQTVHYFRSAK